MSPTTKKVLVAVLIFLTVMVLGCVIFGIVSASWVQEWFGGLAEQGEQATAEARNFAATHDQDACVVEGLRRAEPCAEGELMCEVTAGVFLQSCLDLATPVSGFCDAVPPQTEIMRSAQWAIETCNARGHAGSQRCGRLAQAIQRHCDVERRGR